MEIYLERIRDLLAREFYMVSVVGFILTSVLKLKTITYKSMKKNPRAYT